ncbi:MAG: NADH-quinone oxidoreductase subunit L, partial [Stellaceae bacterium]
AAFFGWLGYGHFVGTGSVGFWKTAILVLPGHDALARAEDIPLVIAYLPLVCGIAGIAMAYLFYIVDPRLPLRLAQRYRELYLFLLNKWYFDELYDLLFVRPAMALGDGLWKSGDGAVIDGLGPNGIAALTRDLARQASRLQTGYLYHYAFVMLIGLAAFVTWYLLPH